MSEDWERGYTAGWNAAMGTARRDIGPAMGETPKVSETAAPKRKREASAYNRRYAAAFKRIAPRHKTKSGAWRKGGFKAANKAAHREAKKGGK